MTGLAEVWVGTSGTCIANPFYRLPTAEMFERWRDSWHTTEVYRLLTNHGVALAFQSAAACTSITTASFTYIRMHRG